MQMLDFKAFCPNISFSTNLLFLKSAAYAKQKILCISKIYITNKGKFTNTVVQIILKAGK